MNGKKRKCQQNCSVQLRLSCDSMSIPFVLFRFVSFAIAADAGEGKTKEMNKP